MEEFDFHISLTDRIPDHVEHESFSTVVKAVGNRILGKPLVIKELSVFRQETADGSMSIIARFPFGRHASYSPAARQIPLDWHNIF